MTDPTQTVKTLYVSAANAQALPYDMEYHPVNNEEHPGSRLRWIAGAGFPGKGRRIKWVLVLT